ncbi:hypothetical protein CUAC110533_07160 [Cutibacterium acnes subsp. elongatum]|jgi:hypothetical protein
MTSMPEETLTQSPVQGSLPNHFEATSQIQHYNMMMAQKRNND